MRAPADHRSCKQLFFGSCHALLSFVMSVVIGKEPLAAIATLIVPHLLTRYQQPDLVG